MSKEDQDFQYNDDGFKDNTEIGSRSIEEIKGEEKPKKKKKKPAEIKPLNSNFNEIEDTYQDGKRD